MDVETAKVLSKILKPLVGKSPHHVKNNKDFIHSLEDIHLKPDECMMPFDVKAFFTSVPIEPAINIIKKHLEEFTPQNSHDSEAHLLSTRILPQKHIFYLPGQAV